MKKPEYMSAKWHKRNEIMLFTNEIEARKKEIEDTNNSSFDDAKKSFLHCLEYNNLARCEYMNKEYENCKQTLNMVIDELINAFIWVEKCDVAVSTRMALKEIQEGREEVYIAYVINRFSDLSQYLISNKIEDFFEKLEDDNLIGMVVSIKEHDEKKLDEFLCKRIKDIRKMSVDYLLIIDFWSLGILKYALENGMRIRTKVIELGFTEQDDNVFI